MDDLGRSAGALAEAGVMIVRAWGVRPSLGRGMICTCNDEASFCRVGLPGAHAIHADPGRTATRDPAVLASWRTAFAGENMLLLTGARSRLAGLQFSDEEAFKAAARQFGPLPVTPTSRAPDGALTAFFRWARPALIDPNALGAGVVVHGEGGRLLVPGSRTLDGAVRWAVPPADARLASLPLQWRAAILDAPRCRVFRAA